MGKPALSWFVVTRRVGIFIYMSTVQGDGRDSISVYRINVRMIKNQC